GARWRTADRPEHRAGASRRYGCQPFSPRSCWRTHALSHGDSMADKRTPAVERRPAHARRSGARRAGEGAMKRLALLLLALCLPLAAAGAATLEPFAASYTIRWGGMNAGTG